jgi:alkylation response protein AidB-like acyl-CoA dehydrogenase
MAMAETRDLVDTSVGTTLERARALQPLIRQHADDAQQNRRLSNEVVEALHDSGLFRMCLPRQFGGEEVDPWTTVETIEAISYADGSTGWNFMIGSETNGLAAGSMLQAQSEEIFGGDPYPRVVFCGAAGPPGTAEQVDGGWKVNGQWGYVSGCHQCHWFFGTAMVMQDGKPVMMTETMPAMRMFLMPISDVEILDTWDVAGMRGSGSHDLLGKDVFVPDARAASMLGMPTWHQSPIFSFPMSAKIGYNKVAVALGVARAALDSVADIAKTKKAFGTPTPINELTSTQIEVAKAEAVLGSARAYVKDTIASVWELVQAGEVPTTEQVAPLRLACTYGGQAAIDAVDLAVRLTNTTANRMDCPLERYQRDVRAVGGHFTIGTALYEPIGKSLLGIELPPMAL